MSQSVLASLPVPAAPSWTDEVSSIATAVGALFTALTFLVAVVAAAVAWRQWRDGRSVREEQAQPSVVVYAQPTPNKPHFADVVIRNMGPTGAHDVRVRCVPELRRSIGRLALTQAVELPEVLPYLAPGQEWLTLWDFAPDRERTDLPDRHEVTTTYTDSRGRVLTTPSVLDWRFFRGRVWAEDKTMHEAASALEGMAATVKEWAQQDRVLRVAAYDGDVYDRRVAEEEEQAREEFERFRRRLEEGRRAAEVTDEEEREGWEPGPAAQLGP